jgi:hypothetical protein
VPRRRDDLVSGCVLGDECGGSRLQCGEQLLVPGIHREHHDSGVVPLLADLLDQLEPEPVRQAYVGDHHLGPEGVVLTQALGDRGGLTADAEGPDG